MINKFEAVGVLVCIGVMSLALFLMRVDSGSSLLSSIEDNSSAAAVVKADGAQMEQTLADSINAVGDLESIIVDDVVIGDGEAVEKGDSVSVHYVGTLQNGQAFDSSYGKGPYTFTVGAGKVIKGWDEGLLGMKEGGQRILVVPSSFAYGSEGYGPIPPNATLVFSIELIDILE